MHLSTFPFFSISSHRRDLANRVHSWRMAMRLVEARVCTRSCRSDTKHSGLYMLCSTAVMAVCVSLPYASSSACSVSARRGTRSSGHDDAMPAQSARDTAGRSCTSQPCTAGPARRASSVRNAAEIYSRFRLEEYNPRVASIVTSRRDGHARTAGSVKRTPRKYSCSSGSSTSSAWAASGWLISGRTAVREDSSRATMSGTTISSRPNRSSTAARTERQRVASGLASSVSCMYVQTFCTKASRMSVPYASSRVSRSHTAAESSGEKPTAATAAVRSPHTLVAKRTMGWTGDVSRDGNASVNCTAAVSTPRQSTSFPDRMSEGCRAISRSAATTGASRRSSCAMTVSTGPETITRTSPSATVAALGRERMAGNWPRIAAYSAVAPTSRGQSRHTRLKESATFSHDSETERNWPKICRMACSCGGLRLSHAEYAAAVPSAVNFTCVLSVTSSANARANVLISALCTSSSIWKNALVTSSCRRGGRGITSEAMHDRANSELSTLCQLMIPPSASIMSVTTVGPFSVAMLSSTSLMRRR
eukprot:m.69502 g.69502  ORF g.69502 m.69502 type:complete len:535 (+) comp14255_c0_seq1:351-1955(+)